MSDAPSIRVSDQERDRAAQEINDHFAAGRLSDDELDDRLDAVGRARTVEELSRLRSDLPQLPATPAQQRAELVRRRGELRRRLLQQTGGALILFMVCTVIWLVSGHGHHGQFWPAWIGLLAALSLVRNGWRLYGPAPELDRVEQELARREHRHDARRARRGRY